MARETPTEPVKDRRVSTEVGSLGCLSPEDERDLAMLLKPTIHPQYNRASAWWTVNIVVMGVDKKLKSYEGKGRTYIHGLSTALANWRIDRRKGGA